MKFSELAVRYAKALYQATPEAHRVRLYSELSSLVAAIEKDPRLGDFFSSPLVSAEHRLKAIEGSLEKLSSLLDETKNLLRVLVTKGRMGRLGEIVGAFQAQADADHDVIRGTVRSAVVLSPEDRIRIEKKVSEVTKKQAILAYREDPSVIGGLIAEVGSFTFDDTIQSHLQRLHEELRSSY